MFTHFSVDCRTHYRRKTGVPDQYLVTELAFMVSGSIEYEMMKTDEQIIDLIRIASFSLFKEIKEKYERA